MTPGLCLPVLGNSACLGPPALVSVVRGPGLRQIGAFQGSIRGLHCLPPLTPFTIQLSRLVLPPFWLPVPHGFLWHRKSSFPSPSSKATSSLLQPHHSLLHFLSVRWISSGSFLLSLANFPSSLGLLSNRRASQAEGGRRGSWALLLTHSELSAPHWLSLSELRRDQPLPPSFSFLPLPSRFPEFPQTLDLSCGIQKWNSDPHSSPVFSAE